ncbi:MAG TPA: adenylosuccinate lyase [Dehalococcoidia bacterium]|nr:adenylosuccinate lyase [Dehalococcoidia bacterium]
MIERYSLPEMKQVWSDDNKYQKWLDVELAACEAWTELGVIPADDMVKLRSATYNYTRMMEILDVTKHDVTAFLQSITEQISEEGRWLHLGLTSSDMMDTALGMQLKQAGVLLVKDMDLAIEAVSKKATEHKKTIMMGRTHGIHAEPITFGLKMALWLQELKRQKQRLLRAIDEIAVGKISGPVGSYATVSPELEQIVCQKLELEATEISNQIIQRDRHANFVTTLAIIAGSLEKFATEIRSLQRSEIHEVEEPFGSGQTGSSSMPHKRNPELSERICGLSRLIRGHSVSAIENIALWGERDISHSSVERIILPDSCLALDYMFNIFTRIMTGLKVLPEEMWNNLESSRGLVFSQRILLSLIDKGASREDSYKIVQSNAMNAWDNGKDFRDLIRSDAQVSKHLSADELESIFDYDYYLRFIDETFDKIGI